jgi:hypothetical protein
MSVLMRESAAVSDMGHPFRFLSPATFIAGIGRGTISVWQQAGIAQFW